MYSRTLNAALAATFVALIAAPVAAGPAKAPVPQTEQPATPPAEVLLASSEIRAPAQQSDGQTSAPAKRPRAARVTSCRCAGQTPQQP